MILLMAERCHLSISHLKFLFMRLKAMIFYGRGVATYLEATFLIFTGFSVLSGRWKQQS